MQRVATACLASVTFSACPSAVLDDEIPPPPPLAGETVPTAPTQIQPITVTLHSGETRVFTVGITELRAFVDLRAGEALRFAAGQDQVDIALRIRPPDEAWTAFDNPARHAASERLCFVADVEGRYEVSIGLARPQPAGSSPIAMEVRTAIDADRACVEMFHELRQGAALETEGEAELAASRFESAHNLATASKDEDGEAIAALHGLNLAERFPGRAPLDDAIRRCDAARERLRQPEAGELAISLQQRVALAERNRGHLDQAETRFRQSLDAATTIGSHASQAEAHVGLGLVQITRGDYAAALDSLGRAVRYWQEVGRPADHARALVRLAFVHTVRSEIIEARDRLAEAEALLPQDERQTRGLILIQRGWLDFLEQRYETAIKTYEDALNYLRPPPGSSQRGTILDRLASAEHARGNLSRAEALYRQVLDIYLPLGGQWVANARFSLATVQMDLGEFAKARRLLESSLDTYRKIGDDNSTAHALATLGSVARREGDLKGATARLEEAAQRFEARWRQSLERGDLIRPTAMVQDIDAQLVDLLMERSARENDPILARHAFALGDRARDRSLVALIGSGIAQAPPSSSDIANAQDALRADIDRLELQRAHGSPGLERQIRRFQGELDSLDRAQRSARLDAATTLEPLDTSDLQRLLPTRTCLLSYVLGSDRSFGFVICRDRFLSVILPAQAEIEAWAQALLASMSGSEMYGAGAQADLTRKGLAGVLVSPIADVIADAERLIVVADGTLGQIPFASLPSTPSKEGEMALLDALDVLQAPSAGVYMALRRRQDERPRSDGSIIVFADPVYSASDSRLAPEGIDEPGHRGGTGTWPRLPSTNSEALAIQGLAPDRTRLFLGAAANRDAVLGFDLASASIVHFAVHGDLDDEVPTSSGLVLSSFDADGIPRPSHLRLREIRDLKLNTDLVVLSACQSAWSQTVRGDALLGLAQAFLTAGATRVLVTLWPVDDEATAALMASFYRSMLVDGQSPERALRHAQREIRATRPWRLPFYWAGFVLLGG